MGKFLNSIGLSYNKIAQYFGFKNYNSFNTSSAKKRYLNGLKKSLQDNQFRWFLLCQMAKAGGEYAGFRMSYKDGILFDNGEKSWFMESTDHEMFNHVFEQLFY